MPYNVPENVLITPHRRFYVLGNSDTIHLLQLAVKLLAN